MKTKVKFISSIVSADFMGASDVMIWLPAARDHAMNQIFKSRKTARRFFYKTSFGKNIL